MQLLHVLKALWGGGYILYLTFHALNDNVSGLLHIATISQQIARPFYSMILSRVYYEREGGRIWNCYILCVTAVCTVRDLHNGYSCLDSGQTVMYT